MTRVAYCADVGSSNIEELYAAPLVLRPTTSYAGPIRDERVR